LLEARFRQGIADGELRADTDAGGLARFVGAILQGMTVQTQDGAGDADLLPIAELAIAEVGRTAAVRLGDRPPGAGQKSMPGPGGGVGGFFFGFSATIASVVTSRPATDAASCSAARTTFAGSMTPMR
jgi:hypothetical protein